MAVKPTTTTKDTRVSLMSTIGKTGLPEYSGYVFDEWLPELQGQAGIRVLREMMDNDAMIGALLFAIEMLLRRVEWRMEAGDKGAEHELAAEFIHDCLHDMAESWEDTLAQVLSFLGYGFSMHEIVYKRRQGPNAEPPSKFSDNQLGWDGWPMRAQETTQRWEFGPNQEILGMWQLGPPDWTYHFIPMSKGLLFRASTRRGSPQGRSILRTAYRAWYFKKHTEQAEAVGLERDLAGYPVMWLPLEMMRDTASDGDKATYAAFQAAVRQVRRDELEGMIMPQAYDPETKQKLFDFQLLKGAGERQFDTDAIVGRYNEQILISVLAGFLILGHEGTGSYALGKAIGELFITALKGWLGMVTAQVNNRAIPRLLRLNGYSDAVLMSPPQLKHGEIAEPDLSELGNYLKVLGNPTTGVGMQLDLSPGGALHNYLLAQANLPRQPDAPKDEVSATEPAPGAVRKRAVPPSRQSRRRPPTNENGNGHAELDQPFDHIMAELFPRGR